MPEAPDAVTVKRAVLDAIAVDPKARSIRTGVLAAGRGCAAPRLAARTRIGTDAKFSVITGLSGSGKSSLAFDTIYAEGQRQGVQAQRAQG